MDVGIPLFGNITDDASQLMRIQMRPIDLGAYRPQRLQRGRVTDSHNIAGPRHQRLDGADGQADLTHLQQA